MALAIDGSTPAIKTSNVAACTTDSFTPPSGSLLLIRWSGNSTSLPAQPTITDNLGGHLSYTLLDWQSHADTPNVDGQAATWWAVVGTSAAMTVTVTNQATSGFVHAGGNYWHLYNRAADLYARVWMARPPSWRQVGEVGISGDGRIVIVSASSRLTAAGPDERVDTTTAGTRTVTVDAAGRIVSTFEGGRL